MIVRLHPEARIEFLAAADWYEERRPGLGPTFAAAILSALDLIGETVEAWPEWPDTPPGLRIRRFVVEGFPYAIAYVVKDDAAVAIAVAHARRAPLYWLHRATEE